MPCFALQLVETTTEKIDDRRALLLFCYYRASKHNIKVKGLFLWKLGSSVLTSRKTYIWEETSRKALKSRRVPSHSTSLGP
jgi:hypothetical protein